MQGIDRSVVIRGLLAIALLVLAAPAAVAGDPATTPNVKVMAPGQIIPGYEDGPVAFAPQSLAYGGDGWVINLTMDGYVELVVGENGIGAWEGQVLAGGDVVDENWISLDSSPEGRIAQSVLLDDANRSLAIVMDGAVALKEGDVVDAPGVQSGWRWEDLTSVDLDEAGHLTALGTIEPPIFSDSRDIIVRYDIDAGGAVQDPEVLIQKFDLVAGRTVQSVGYSGDLSWGANTAGEVIAPLTLNGPGPGDPGAVVIALGDTILAEDGTDSILSGRDWQVSIGDIVDLNSQGDHAFLTHIDGGISGSWRILVKNGQVLALEDSPAPGLPGTQLTYFLGPRLAEDGSVLWYAEWDDGGVEKKGFFVDDELFVQVGETIIDTHPLTGVDQSILNWDIAEDGSSFLFEGFHQFGGWGAYEVSLKPWISLGGGLAGTAGIAPQLTGDGSMEGGTTIALDLTDALASSTTALVVGFAELGAPFKGGTLCPTPDSILSGLPVDGSGALSLSGPWPVGVPAGTEFYWQFWTVDAGGPNGFSASNCLRSTAP